MLVYTRVISTFWTNLIIYNNNIAKGGERFRNLDWQRRANGSSPRPLDHPMPGLKTHRAILGGEQGCPKKKQHIKIG